MLSGYMDIREATPQDYDAIVRLVPTREELFLVYPKGQYPFSVEQLEQLADTRRELTVAVQNGQVIGFANLYDLQEGRWAFIGNVVVARTMRGTGLGRKLVTHMIRLAREKYDVAEVRISVFSENVPALLLYTGLGFEPYAVEERHDPAGRRAALVHMRLP